MPNKLRVTTILYDDFELLDVFGPLEMFGVLGDRFDLKLVSQRGSAMKSSQGPVINVDFSFADDVATDILLIPGGYGAKTQVNNGELIEWLLRKCESSACVASVCTGAALLARTGLLNKKRATTNKLDFAWVVTQGPEVQWVRVARWVEDGKYITSSGISAGIDMSLALIGKLCGEAVADEAAEKTEYVREKDAGNDPFAKRYGLV
jgi:transcriptional regulator GlxA family with amidase domain